MIVTLLVLDNRQVAWPFAAGMAASFAGVSIVVAAVFLPRFVVWLVPLAALLAARTVQRRPPARPVTQPTADRRGPSGRARGAAPG